MKRTLDLARRGTEWVHPNPRVGACIVYEGKVIGEGYHHKFGDAHAEVEAINSVKDTNLLKKSTIYVNLEPCSHYGKTPPCSDLIIHHKIPRVVIANLDPNPEVAGSGVKRLVENGVEVKVGVMEDEGEWLNRRFFFFHRSGMPYVTLKWARTEDGFMGRRSEDKASGKISNRISDIMVHRLRAIHDGILIGGNTLRTDNPSLTTRLWPGPNPIRIILSSSINDLSTYHISELEGENRIISAAGRELKDILIELGKTGVQQLLVEGGNQVLTEFIREGLWNEAHVITAPVEWKAGIKAPEIAGNQIETSMIHGDRWDHYLNPKVS